MSHRRTVAIIQARMGASRLPGKVLLDLGGQPMLARVVERTRRARLLDDIIVATTTDHQDEAIKKLCNERGYPVYRGSSHDVLDRFYQAAHQVRADLVVRITADCPVVDPQVIDLTIETFLESGVDFAADRLPPPWKRTYPIGLDVEVCSFAALERAWREADQPYHREHVMPYLYEGISPGALSEQVASTANHQSLVLHVTSPRGFRIALLQHDPDYGSLRWTVDTSEDLELMRRLFARFGNRDDFSWQDVLALWQHEPEMFAVNASIEHKTAFDVDDRRMKD